MTTKESTVARSELLKVNLSAIEVDETTNVRQTYRDEHIAELATSIAKTGINKPLTVSRDAKDPERFVLLAGFCRVRAVKSLYPDTWKDVLVPISVVTAKSPEEMLQYNIGDDESAEKPKRSEVAERLHYMVEEVGIKQSKLAERTGMSQGDISRMVTAYKRLHPDVLAEWKKAPTREEEIPFSLLYNWSQYKPEQQLMALQHYQAPPPEGEVSEEEDEESEEGEDKGKKRKKKEDKEILHKVRGKREIEAMLAKYLEKEERTEAEEGVRKALEWCLSERATIRL